MTDDHALMAAILTTPGDDLPRLVYADWLEEHAGASECAACLGSGSHALNPYELASRFGTYNAGKIIDAARCGVCHGSGRVPNHFAARAEFIRVQCEHGLPISRDNFPFPKHRRDIELLMSMTDLIDATARLFGATAKDKRNSNYGCVGSAGGLSWTWQRGFLAEIKLPLAALVGGPCDNCEGTGELIDPAGPCPDCGGQFEPIERPGDRGRSPGTGRTTGLAADLFKNHPIERVVLSDRNRRSVAFEGYGWTCNPEWEYDTAAYLPPDLAALLVGGVMDTDDEFRCWDTEQQANGALSAACVAYGRSLAFPEPAGASA